MERETILVVDDDPAIREQLAIALGRNWRVMTAATSKEALRAAESSVPSLITLDLSLRPDGGDPEEGMSLLGRFLERDPHVKVILITGNDDRATARRAVQAGAWDYYEKPVNLEELDVLVRRALHVRSLEVETRTLREGVTTASRLEDMVGGSPGMREVYDAVSRVAPTDLSVLITGESGTGKELVAHAIHRRSPRQAGPFVPVHCGAIPAALLESELFGRARGASPEASGRREGKLELAGSGTVFLDEVGEFSPELQVKMLGFLQDGALERPGSAERIAVDARLLAATSRDLPKEIERGAFREDLYYRLGVVVIHLPPLRERGGDIMLLANHFLERSCRELNKRVSGFSRGSLRALEKHAWPGNVRELENRVKRAVLMTRRPRLTPEDLGLEESGRPELAQLAEARDELERRLLGEALRRNAGNVSRAARDLGVSRATVHDLMKKHRMPAAGYRAAGATEE